MRHRKRCVSKVKFLNSNQKLACEKILDDLDSLVVTTESRHKKFQLYSDSQLQFHQVKNYLFDLFVKLGIKRQRNFLSRYKTQKIQKSFNNSNIKKSVGLFLKSKFFKNKKGKTKINEISDVLFEIDEIN